MNAIVLTDVKGGIAKDGRQPITFKEDRIRFKQITEWHPVVFGRSTLQDFYNPEDDAFHPLKNRWNFVLTHNPKYVPPGFYPVTLDELLKLPHGIRDEMYVIGGAETYETLLKHCKHILITRVCMDFNCDKFFPTLDIDTWERSEVLYDHITLPETSASPELTFTCMFEMYTKRCET